MYSKKSQLRYLICTYQASITLEMAVIKNSNIYIYISFIHLYCIVKRVLDGEIKIQSNNIEYRISENSYNNFFATLSFMYFLNFRQKKKKNLKIVKYLKKLIKLQYIYICIYM